MINSQHAAKSGQAKKESAAGWDKAVGAVNQRIAPTASAEKGGWDAVIEQINSTQDAPI